MFPVLHIDHSSFPYLSFKSDNLARNAFCVFLICIYIEITINDYSLKVVSPFLSGNYWNCGLFILISYLPTEIVLKLLLSVGFLLITFVLNRDSIENYSVISCPIIALQLAYSCHINSYLPHLRQERT